MKNGQLVYSPMGLLRIEEIISDSCIYCRILTGIRKGGLTCEYATTIFVLKDTEDLVIY